MLAESATIPLMFPFNPDKACAMQASLPVGMTYPHKEERT